MEIKRIILKKLTAWKQAPDRKPLILQGARQVGKTWLLTHFGAAEFDNVAYFNFEAQPDLKQFFENTKDVPRIVQNLSLVHGQPILPQKTLIIFDEIQECNDALNTLKYFCENFGIPNLLYRVTTLNQDTYFFFINSCFSRRNHFKNCS